MKQKEYIRLKFRNEVFERDNYECVICEASKGEVEKLDAHHIIDRNEMPNGGYVKENGITLCPSCHMKAEKFHITNGWDWEEGFHPNSLFLRIRSSYERALEASKSLSNE